MSETSFPSIFQNEATPNLLPMPGLEQHLQTTTQIPTTNDDLQRQIDRLNARLTKLEDEVLRLQKKPENRSKGRQAINGYNSELVTMVKRLAAAWPKTRGLEQAPIRNNLVDCCARVKHILDSFDVQLEELEASTMDWIKTQPVYANCIQFYFGPGKPGEISRWRTELEGYKTRRSMAEGRE
jgi:uncharacterized small protein (DUF1192 family)